MINTNLMQAEFITPAQMTKIIDAKRMMHLASIKVLIDDVLADIDNDLNVANNYNNVMIEMSIVVDAEEVYAWHTR